MEYRYLNPSGKVINLFSARSLTLSHVDMLSFYKGYDSLILLTWDCFVTRGGWKLVGAGQTNWEN